MITYTDMSKDQLLKYAVLRRNCRLGEIMHMTKLELVEHINKLDAQERYEQLQEKKVRRKNNIKKFCESAATVNINEVREKPRKTYWWTCKGCGKKTRNTTKLCDNCEEKKR